MLIGCFCLKAQTNTPHKLDEKIFIECGGPGFGISMNFQQKIITNKKGGILSCRAGLGAIGPIPSSSILLTLPIGLQYRLGSNNKFEIAAGATLFYFTDNVFEGPGLFISLAYYINPAIRIMVSPFFAKRSTLKSYFNLNEPILPFGGFDIIVFLVKKTNRSTHYPRKH
jgi:hypothetical protein